MKEKLICKQDTKIRSEKEIMRHLGEDYDRKFEWKYYLIEELDVFQIDREHNLYNINLKRYNGNLNTKCLFNVAFNIIYIILS